MVVLAARRDISSVEIPGPAAALGPQLQCETPSVRHYGNRFQRSEAARTAILEAVDDLLLERGFATLTMEAVAARAGVGKQTIYRWWPSKTDLLLDAFLEEVEEEMTPIDLGNLRADLGRRAEQLVEFFNQPSNAAMFRALAGQAQHDPAVARRFHEDVVGQQRDRDRAPFEHARRRGELPPGLDVTRSIEVLTAPIYYRLLVTGEPLAAADAERTVSEWLSRHVIPLAAAARRTS